MADITFPVAGGVSKRLKDMGDGSHAEKITAGGITPRLTATFTRAASATQYSIGDAFTNTEVAASSVPLTWDLGGLYSGRVIGGSMVVAAASGTVVLSALAIDLYLFRPETNIPFASGSYPADNAAVSFTATAMRECLGILRFTNAHWLNNVGSNSAAGGFLYQGSAITTLNSRPFAPFNLAGLTSTAIRGVCVMRDVWNPGNVAQQVDVALDVDLD